MSTTASRRSTSGCGAIFADRACPLPVSLSHRTRIPVKNVLRYGRSVRIMWSAVQNNPKGQHPMPDIDTADVVAGKKRRGPQARRRIDLPSGDYLEPRAEFAERGLGVTDRTAKRM